MRLRLYFTFAVAAAVPVFAEPEPKPAAPPSSDDLYKLGKALFDDYAPPEIKEQYEFPSKEQWDEFAVRLQHALESENPAELAAYEPEARAALAALRALPGYEDYADWLAERLDYIEAAKELTTHPSRPPVVGGGPVAAIPSLDLWRARLKNRPVPASAEKLMPVLRAEFTAVGVPPALAWLAEVESTLNPNARNPSGARGLFQLMPATAKGLGLSTFLPDDRTDPAKSARAAAHLLSELHGRFGDWPLALAAYNAGAGRVRRLLEKTGATTFAGIASGLPVETRLYVPKVLATVEARTGQPVAKLLSSARS